MPQCRYLHSHITDSLFFRHSYATDEVRQVFCDLRRMQRWLEVETAMAQCQAELNIIPAAAAQRLTQTARLEDFDLKAIQADIARTGHSLVPLLREWQRVTADEAGEYIHYGATTQDIQDTGQTLELREVTTIIQRDLAEVILTLAQLTVDHKALVMIGRTHGQAALPTTLGLKIAGWLDESLRNFGRLQNCLKTLLTCQLSGGVGTMDSLSGQAQVLLHNFAASLGLQAPITSWHASRDRTAEFLAVLALITGGLARIANEVCQLARNEIGELTEPFHNGQIGSSTMPHKKNPELCEQVVVLAKLVKANTVSGFDCLINEHERDYRAVRLEWAALTEASMFSCAALNLMKKILAGLNVHRDRIEKNLAAAAMMVSTEALMFVLAKKIGKQSAHELIYQTALDCNDDIGDLLQKLQQAPALEGEFSLGDLQRAIDPAGHTGCAADIVEQLIKQVNFQELKELKGKPVLSCPLRNTLCGSQ